MVQVRMNGMPNNLDEFYYIRTTDGEFIIFHHTIAKGKFILRPTKITSVCSERTAKILIGGLQSGKISENLFND